MRNPIQGKKSHSSYESGKKNTLPKRAPQTAAKTARSPGTRYTGSDSSRSVPGSARNPADTARTRGTAVSYKVDRTTSVGQRLKQGRENEATEQIEGRHPVLEALRTGRTIRLIYLLDGGEGAVLDDIQKLADDRGITVRRLPRKELDNLSENRLHQGVIAICGVKQLSDVDDILALASQRGEQPFILLLDGLEDPQNVGSLIRSAEAAGCHGVIMRERRAAAITPVLIKATAGAWEHILVAQVVNIPRAIDELKKANIWIVGADMSGDSVYGVKLQGALALVVGSEGAGLSRLAKERCDALVSLPMHGAISSLGVAAAGSILLYEVIRQKQG